MYIYKNSYRTFQNVVGYKKWINSLILVRSMSTSAILLNACNVKSSHNCRAFWKSWDSPYFVVIIIIMLKSKKTLTCSLVIHESSKNIYIPKTFRSVWFIKHVSNLLYQPRITECIKQTSLLFTINTCLKNYPNIVCNVVTQCQHWRAFFHPPYIFNLKCYLRLLLGWILCTVQIINQYQGLQCNTNSIILLR